MVSRCAIGECKIHCNIDFAAGLQPDEQNIELANLRARVAPSLAVFCLNYHHGRLDSPYRLYEILRTLDAGQGAIPYATIKAVLTNRLGNLYLYGRRRLLEVLKRGDGVFWHRACNSSGELVVWLHGRARVAAHLGIVLTGRESLIPLRALIAGDVDSNRGRQAEANAALHATFHAGRVKQKTTNKLVQSVELATLGKIQTRPLNPIGRDKLIKASGISKYRQRSYERRVGIRYTRNFQIAEASDHTIERARYQGIPVFKFIDHAGRFGPVGQAYGARRLPNTYHAPDTIGPLFSLRTRKLNDSVERLRISAIGGDGTLSLPTAGHQPDEFIRVFYTDGEAADKAWARDGNLLYVQTRPAIGGVSFWRRIAPKHRK